jgi:hypothetical protein
MLFSFFKFFKSGKVVNDFANSLALELAKRYPPSMEQGSERKMSPKGLSNILEGLYQKATEFKQANKLGIYTTAKLSNTFRWELKELGYSEKFIEVATEGLIVFLTRKPGTTSNTTEK